MASRFKHGKKLVKWKYLCWALKSVKTDFPSRVRNQSMYSSVKMRIFPASINLIAWCFNSSPISSALCAGKNEHTWLHLTWLGFKYALSSNPRESSAFSNAAQLPHICPVCCWQLCMFALESAQVSFSAFARKSTYLSQTLFFFLTFLLFY